jgi:hypothetical protein
MGRMLEMKKKYKEERMKRNEERRKYKIAKSESK